MGISKLEYYNLGESAFNDDIVIESNENVIIKEEQQIEELDCIKCKKRKSIYSKKLCKSCYNTIHRDKIKQIECNKRWFRKNPLYIRDYWRKKRQKNE